MGTRRTAVMPPWPSRPVTEPAVGTLLAGQRRSLGGSLLGGLDDAGALGIDHRSPSWPRRRSASSRRTSRVRWPLVNHLSTRARALAATRLAGPDGGGLLEGGEIVQRGHGAGR